MEKIKVSFYFVYNEENLFFFLYKLSQILKRLEFERIAMMAIMILDENAHREFWLQINSITSNPCTVLPSRHHSVRVSHFEQSLINNLVAFVGAFISVFVDKHCEMSSLTPRDSQYTHTCVKQVETRLGRVRYTGCHVQRRSVALCALRDFDVSIRHPASPRASFPNANCLRISNEPLKYRTQKQRPPEAKAATGTHARNAVNERNSAGRGQRVAKSAPVTISSR